MRTLCLFLFMLPLCAFSQQNNLDKKISLSIKEETLAQTLLAITDLSEIEFSYSDDVVPTNNIVSISAQSETVRAVLDKLLFDLSIDYKFTNGRVVLRKAPAPLTQSGRGVVVDHYTHAPIPGANIIVIDTDPLLGSTSDADGKFKIPAVPVGRLSIRITSVGYQTRTISNILMGTGKELVLEITLIESFTAIDEVVITGSNNSDVTASEATVVSARSFSVEETKRYAGSLGDPARMASSFAGVTGASDESNALIVRGNSPRGVLWRVDGIEVPNPNHFASEGSSSGVISVLSANVIDNSDFLTGAFPAMYGNALSAVFDMKLRNGNSEKREHSFQAGLLGLEASTEGPLNNRHTSSYLVNYRYATLNILEKLGVKLNDAGEYKNYQDLSFKIDLPTQRGRLSVFGIGGSSKSNQEKLNALASDHSDMGVVGTTYQQTFNQQTSFTSSLSWSGTRIANYHEVLGLSSGVMKIEENYHKSYARASVLIERKANEIFFTGGIIYSQLFYNFYLRNLDPTNFTYQEVINFQEQNNTGIFQGFVTASQKFSSTLSATYGVHVIRFGLTNDRSIEPRAAIRWNVTPDKNFSFGYGKHSRIENLQYYLARDHQLGGNEVKINKDLGFTRANHYVMGYNQFFHHGNRLHVETYYQQLYNAPVQADPSSMYATLNEDAGFITDTLLNNGQGKNYGIEISLEKSFAKNFYYLLNGSLYQSKFRLGEGEEQNTTYNGNYNFHFLMGKEFKINSARSTIGVNVKLTSAGGRRYIPIDEEKSIEGSRAIYDWDKAFDSQFANYFRADLQLVYRVNKPRYAIEWRLDIQNVTNRSNAAYYFYHVPSQSVQLKYQVGLLPIFSYRIEF